MGAELRHHCPQQPLLQTSLYCQCELRPHVSKLPSPVLSPCYSHVKLAKPVQEFTVPVSVFAHRDVECKELQLSDDQSRATKPGLSLASVQDHRKQLKTKAVKMKTKLRAVHYPEVGIPLGLLSKQKVIVFTLLYLI